MARLEHPNGVVVNVSDALAERLVTEGWKRPSATAPEKQTSRKTTPRKSKSENE